MLTNDRLKHHMTSKRYLSQHFLVDVAYLRGNPAKKLAPIDLTSESRIAGVAESVKTISTTFRPVG